MQNKFSYHSIWYNIDELLIFFEERLYKKITTNYFWVGRAFIRSEQDYMIICTIKYFKQSSTEYHDALKEILKNSEKVDNLLLFDTDYTRLIFLCRHYLLVLCNVVFPPASNLNNLHIRHSNKHNNQQ
jgi:hypothetical protein